MVVWLGFGAAECIEPGNIIDIVLESARWARSGATDLFGLLL
jgi:hypothetical protein